MPSLALWDSTDLGVFPIMEERTWNQYNNLGLGLRATLLEDMDLIPRIHTVTHKLLTPVSDILLASIGNSQALVHRHTCRQITHIHTITKTVLYFL